MQQPEITEFFSPKEFDNSINVYRDIDGRPSPLVMVVDEVDVVYEIRLTPMGAYSRLDVQQWLDETFLVWLLSVEKEGTAELHFHIVCSDDVSIDLVREKVKLFLKRYFVKFTRGDGNRQYHLSKVGSFEACVKYLVKDGVVFHSDGIDPRVVTELKRESFKKFNKVVFAKALQKIRDNVLARRDTYISKRDVMVHVLVLKASYCQTLNMRYVAELAESWIAASLKGQNQVIYVRQLVDKFLDTN